MRGGEKGGLEGGSPLPGLTEEQTVAVTRQANIYWTLAFIARLFKLYNSLSCHHLNDWPVSGWPLRSQPSRTLPRLAPTLPLHPGLPFHSPRLRWVTFHSFSLCSHFLFCSQGLDDEVPEFSFVNLFCFVDLSFDTSRGTFPFPFVHICHHIHFCVSRLSFVHI